MEAENELLETEPSQPEVNVPAPENAEDSKDKALVEMSKKLKEKEHLLKELSEKAKAAEAMTEQYNALIEETYAQKAVSELKNFAKSYNIPNEVMEQIVKQYNEKPEALYKNVDNVEEFLVKNHFTTFKPYITGTGKPNEKPAPSTPLNLATGTGAVTPGVDKRALFKAQQQTWHEKTALWGHVIKKGNK